MLARTEDNGSKGWWEGGGFWWLLDAVVWVVDLEGWITWFVIGWDEGGKEGFCAGDGGDLLCISGSHVDLYNPKTVDQAVREVSLS